MYRKIEGGTIMNIQGLDCCIPPEGYVWNVLTNKLEYTGVYQRSDIPEEQYWERFPMPSWYKEVTKKEDDYLKRKKEDDPQFYDEKYEAFKQQEWFRRLNGFWFKNYNPKTQQSESVYLTGFYYMLLQWFNIDIGYAKFIFPHLKKTYFLEYCIQDPICMGMIDVTKRRFLKTFIGGLFILEYVTRTKMVNGALQSKTGNDAKKVFGKAVVYPFRKFPRFFRPEYDMSLGINPKTEIRFQQTNVRGKKAEDGIDKDELGSMIDWGSADPIHYDGSKVHRYFSDEWGKTTEANVFDRHEVIRYCLLDEEGNIIGKALYSTTVEKLESDKDGVQEAAIQLWEASDQNKREENGMTPSGLYRFFQTADEGRNFDIYGYPDVEKTIQQILADRKSVENNARSLAARKRKEPRTIKEAFYEGNDRCEFNPKNITDQIEELELNPPSIRQLRLITEMVTDIPQWPTTKPKPKEIVKPMDDEKGGWFILEFPLKPNHYSHYGKMEPLNKSMYQIGVDTTQDRIAIEGSNPAICVFKKSLIINGEETGNYPVALWISPTRLDIHFDEEVRKACMWYGCTANYEIDRRTDFYRWFCSKESQLFLEWTPKIARNPLKPNKDPEYGTRSGDPFQLAQQLQVTKMYIDGTNIEDYNGHVHRIKYISLLKQLLDYDHLNRTKSDLVISLMMSLLPIFGESQVGKSETQRPKAILPKYAIKIPA